MSKDLSFEEYIKPEIESGNMAEDGTPLKCECGCDQLHKSEISMYEYDYICNNCNNIVGTWSYGSWIL